MAADIGLSWLAAQCEDLEYLPVEELDCLVEQGPLAAVLRIAARSVTDLDSPAALQLGKDVQLLLRSPFPDETIRTLWLGATDDSFDPARDGVDARTWLQRIEGAWLAAERRADPAFVPPSAAPVTDKQLRRLVLQVIHLVAGDLTKAAEESIYPLPLPGLVPALERTVVEVCADLGYRLFLRAVKSYFVAIDKSTCDAFVALAKRFGHPESLVTVDMNCRD
ncbi:hypothetical protein [Streptomyces poonensis]|uniref:Uncharacterized protein n=1 Tax=Streptomyces poonensis TaxID=68255 RepID=A0A918UH96_9ACTN|nr:hypothetical protein [Streptomyces poonensis]GGZ11538.1 hypothetical protein GCM10010365_33890 [Streptomyces poonensis]GLJ92696.1 hypothetical protein GCM10017589_53060 [Streptomyces poonensis]